MSTRINSLFVLILLSATLASCTSSQSSLFMGAEPEAGSVQTRTPRTLRLYFEELPDVPNSTVTLQAADGRMLNTRGMHTMGANDLMMEINDDVPNGQYTVQWTAAFEGSSAQDTGSFSFTVNSAN